MLLGVFNTNLVLSDSCFRPSHGSASRLRLPTTKNKLQTKLGSKLARFLVIESTQTLFASTPGCVCSPHWRRITFAALASNHANQLWPVCVLIFWAKQTAIHVNLMRSRCFPPQNSPLQKLFDGKTARAYHTGLGISHTLRQ